MRIAFIVQRYGTEILGGSEYHCRLIAERLAPKHQVEILTTCAQDYVTWKNEYPEGADRVRGVTVRRFANGRTRDIDAFDKYSEWIYGNPHSRNDEMEWLKQQGPWCPALIEYLRKHQQQYDVLIFFTYLYAPTVLGLEVAPSRSVLVSTAHDEPAIRLEIFKDVFRRPAALCCLTESEREFVHQQFPERPLLEDVIGVGIEIPPSQPYPRMPAVVEEDSTAEGGRSPDASRADDASRSDDASGLRSHIEEASYGQARQSAEGAAAARLEADATTASRSEASASGDEAATARGYPSHLLARGSVFRRRHRLYGPIVLYGG